MYIHNALLGIQVVLGVSAYRSRKKVRLGIVSGSKIRRALEIVCLILIIGVSIVFYANWANKAALKTYIIYNPAYVTNEIIALLWVIIAYVVITYKNVKPLEE